MWLYLENDPDFFNDTEEHRRVVMEMQEVSSSNIKKVGYDEDTQTMGVIFHNGYFYHFSDVPKEVYEELISAPSIGQQFNATIRNQYEYQNIGMVNE